MKRLLCIYIYTIDYTSSNDIIDIANLVVEGCIYKNTPSIRVLGVQKPLEGGTTSLQQGQ